MYAIRSYYVGDWPDGAREVAIAALPACSRISIRFTARRLALILNISDVITSYSIHYTKLYESVVSTASWTGSSTGCSGAEAQDRGRIISAVSAAGIRNHFLIRFIITPRINIRFYRAYHKDNPIFEYYSSL